MPRIHECPKCGEPMEYSEADPDTGILVSAWECNCGHVEIAEYDDDFDLDRP